MALTSRGTARTIDEYLAPLPPDKRAALQRLRRQIRAAAPGAQECVSYGVPGFRLDGKPLVHFGAAAKHCAFYPGAVAGQYKRELEGYDTSKGTIRFQPDSPLPPALVRKLVKAQIARRGAGARRAAGQARRDSRSPARSRQAAVTAAGAGERESMGGAVDKARLLKRIADRWTAFQASYAGLPAAEMAEPGVTGTWSVKDIIAHVTVWEEEALTHLPVVLAGRRPPRYAVTHGGINAFNAKMTARNRSLSLVDVIRRRDDTHRRLVRFVQGVPESECGGDTRFRRRLRLDTYGHYAVHTRAILAWRERRAAR